MPGFDVVVVGNIGIDTNVYLPPGQDGNGAVEGAFTENVDCIGHAGAYGAFGFRALGCRTGFIGYVGDDVLGRWITAELADAGVEALLPIDPAGTSRSVNLISAAAERRSFYDGKSHLGLAPDLDSCRAFLAGARHLHLNIPHWARRLLPVARELGLTVSVDLQDMTSLDDPYRRDFVDGADVVFCSAVNLDPTELGAALRARNPEALVVLGMGSRGAGLATAEGFRHFLPVSHTAPVIDPNGAGDSLAVGFVTAHLLDGRPIDEAMAWGQTAARHACTIRAKWRRLITRAVLVESLR
jgi:sugar/nucleoside kinase (ribokinase family)